MSDEIPQWAKERACELANEERNSWPGYCSWDYGPSDFVKGYNCSPVLVQLARYIAQHEQPPVDPDLVKAREICARVAREVSPSERDVHEEYRDGSYDNYPEVQFALSALKEARNG